MRVATMIVSLFLMLLVGVQSCTLYVGGSVLNQQQTAGAAAVGILVALLFLIGGAFALGQPTVSMVIFAIAAIFSFIAAATSNFSDLNIWGVVALILGVMSFFGRREVIRKKQKKVAAEQAMATQMATMQAMQAQLQAMQNPPVQGPQNPAL